MIEDDLYFTVEGDGSPVVLIHGLFGMGGNLGALARELRASHRVYSIDLPNHGRSPWVAGADIPVLAESVLAWMQARNLERAALVGHSLGGKVAMQLALQQPARVESLVVADIAPVAYPPSHDAVFAALNAVAQAQVKSRSQAGELMAQMLTEAQVVQFLLLSLARGDDGCYHWRFNLSELERGYAAIRSALNLVDSPYGGPVLFIKGGLSDYILAEHEQAIRALFPAAEVKVIPDTGHWLHAEQPRLFNSLVRRFLARG